MYYLHITLTNEYISDEYCFNFSMLYFVIKHLIWESHSSYVVLTKIYIKIVIQIYLTAYSLDE